MIAIIDYGLGNVRAFANVYTKLNIPFIIAKNTKELEKSHKIIVPGVGSFDYAMNLLEKSGMKELLNDMVQKCNVPVLGVCVGMQMMATSSEEGICPGLGWIDGQVKKFQTSSSQPINVPHMGWNNISPVINSGLMDGLSSESRFYFLHSYYFNCENEEPVLASTHYGNEFTCAIHRKNVYGVQFHPEKSHRWGEKLLENFARL